jgi:oligopeptide transport system substrate-binding protein
MRTQCISFHHQWYRATILLLVALLLGACGAANNNEAAQSLLNRGTGAEPESLDPHKSRTTQAGDLQRDLGEGLIGYSPDGELVAAAAERWTISDDGLTYTFWVRPDAKWSNGDTVTADDFVYSFRRLVDPATAAFYAQTSLGDIDNANEIIAGDKAVESLAVAALDQQRFEIRLHQPVPYFLALLTHPSTFPVHRGAIELHGDAYARPGNLVTNGAYKLLTWEVGSYIEIVRNENYWNNENTAIDRVRHHVTPQPGVELNRYRAGELDITSTVPTGGFQQMREERPDELRVSPSLAVYYYGFNLTQPPFKDNPKLRQALSMAIDRETITEKVVGRGEAPAYSWVPPGTNNYDPRRFSYADMSVDARHKKARQMYREAGYSDTNPVQIEIRYNTSESHRRIAIAVQAMWRDVLGIEATLVNEEFQVLLANVREQAITEVFRSSWTGDYNDAHTFLTILESGNPSNSPGYESAEYGELMAQAARQKDPQLRKTYLEEAERLMLSEHPLMPIYFYVNKSMVNPRVRGWGDNVLNYHYSQHLSLAE